MNTLDRNRDHGLAAPVRIGTTDCSRRWLPVLVLGMGVLAIAGQPILTAVASAQDDTATDATFLAKRHRLEFRAGFWNSDHPEIETSTGTALQRKNVENLMGAFTYAHWVREDLATHLTFSGLVAAVSSIEWATGTTDSTVVLSSALFGVRYYPASSSRMPLQPYLSVGIGPYIGVEAISRIGFGINEKTRVLGTFGGQLGGGLDLLLGRHLMVGVNLGYNLMADFPEPLAGRWNYSGFEVSAGLSVLIGG